jgi:hypothetical protein
MASTSRLLWPVWSLALSFLFTGCGTGNGVAAKTPDSVSQPDFSVTMPASVTVTPNSTQTISISIAGANGFSGAVNVSLSGLPTAVTAAPATFTLSPDTAPQDERGRTATSGGSSGSSQTVVITAGNNAAPDAVPLTVTATSGSITHSAITSTNQPDYALAGPAPMVALAAGASAQIKVSADAFNGFSGQVAGSLAGLPAGVTATPSSLNLVPGAPQTITLTAAPNVATGSTTLTLQGTSGTLSHNIEFPLTLSPPIMPAADFSLSLSPAGLTLTPGGSAGQVALSASALNGFTGSISVTLSGLPNGVAAQPSSFVLNPASSQNISFSAASTDRAQTATATLTATSAGLTHTATLPLTVTQPTPGFNLQVTPASLTLTQGGPSQALNITATATNGFSGQVTLAFSGSANITVSPNSVALAPGIAQTVNVSAAANATAGANTVIVTGSSGSITQTSSVPVTVNSSAPDFTLSVYPSVFNLTPGANAPMEPIEILATPLNNFSDPIAVTFSGLSPAVQWSGGPLPLAPGIPQGTELAQSTAVAGSQIVTVTATSPTVTHSVQFTMNTSDTVVPDFAILATPTALLLAPGKTSISTGPVGFNGFGGQVSIELSGLPAGASANFSSGEETADTPLIVTITVPQGTAPSSGVLALKGTAGTLTHETDIPYSVVANPEIEQYAGPATLTLNQGSTENILLAAETTLAGNITSTANPLPAGVTSPFFGANGFSLSGDGLALYLPLTAATDAPVGQTTLTFTSTDGTNTATSQVLLNVVSQPNFLLSAPPSLTVPAGGTGTFSLEATAINGFSGTVVATLSGVNGLSASPASVTLTPGVAQQITVTATATATNGAISVAATSGTLSQSLQVPITVGPVGPSFTVTGPSGVLQLGTYVDSTFQISTPTNIPLAANAQITGFPSGLLLAEAQDEFGDYNYGAATTLNYLTATPSIGLVPGAASYFSIAYDGAAAGTYPLTLTATWDSITQTIPLTLVVTPPDFTVSLTPQSLTIGPGGTQGFTAAVQVNLSGSVSLTLENLPDGVTSTGQVVLTQSGNASFGVAVSPQAAPGTTMITLSGESTLTRGSYTILSYGSPGAPAHTIQIPLTVTAPSPPNLRCQNP